MTNPTFLFIMITILFISSIIFGISLVIYIVKSKARINSTSGIITNVHLGFSNTRNLIGYNPELEFTDDNGVKYVNKSSLGTIPSSYKIGDVVRVNYNPENPSDAEIGSGYEAFDRQLLTPFILFIAGIFSFGSSIILIGAYILFFVVYPYLNSY